MRWWMPKVGWSSDRESVATVSGTGLVAAVANGRATVTATAGGVSGEAEVTVEQQVAAVEVTPAADTLVSLGDTVRLSAETFDANGHAVVDAEVRWSSDRESVATVSGTGLVAAVANGRATVTATAGGVSGEAEVTVEQQVAAVEVTPAADTLVSLRDTVRLSAEAFDANGHAVADAEVRWSSDRESVVAVSGTGLAEALSNGTATVTATAGGVSGEAQVTVEQRVAAVEVTPAADTLVSLGDTVRLSAEAFDANGHAVTGAEVGWSSDQESVVAVSGTGLAEALSNGTATVTATAGGVSGEAQVTVEQRVAAVEVTPAADTLVSLGDTVRLSAEAFDANGHAVVDAEVGWSSDRESVATVSRTGLVAAVANGRATVTATAGGVSGEAQVTVEQQVAAVEVAPAADTLVSLGDTVRLSAEISDANGHAVADAEVGWSSDRESVVAVSGTGLVTAVANGTATVTATAGGVSGEAQVTVEQQVAAVEVTPAADTLVSLGDTVRLSAEAFDANGHAVTGAEFGWSSDDMAVATVDGTGLVTAKANGTTMITATAGAASGSALVDIDQVPADVAVQPNAVAFGAVGDTARLEATVLDANGHTISDTEVAWASEDSAVASVDASGLVAAEANGTTTVTATAGAASGSASVDVDQVPADIAVQPDAVAFGAVGDTARLEATVLDANGHVIPDPDVAWTSEDPAVASVGTSGLVAAEANGTTTVTATAGAASGSASVDVDQVPADIAVQPDAVAFGAVGDTARLEATVLDANGHAIPDPDIAWTSEDPAVASVDASGLVAAEANGTTTVTATAGAASGSASVDVDQIPADVAVQPNAVALRAVGDTARLEATVLDANGHTISDTEVAWASEDSAVASVNASGLVSAEANGNTTVTATAGAASGSASVNVNVNGEPEIDKITVLPTKLAKTEAGKQGSDTIIVVVTDSTGQPVEDASYHWTTDRHSGWVYPPRGVTDSIGRFAATWVAGWPGDGILSLIVENSVSRMTAELATLSTSSENNPAAAAYFWVNHGSDTATGYSIDLTPLAEPEGTYYAALQWDGGYTGLQRKGSHYDRQLQFSVWDVSEDDTTEVVDTGEGVKCRTFGGEGDGKACYLEYPWKVDSTYRFEMTEAERDGGSDITVHVTDVGADKQRFVATLWYARRAKLTYFGMFVEDFLMLAEHCLAQDVRSAAIKKAMARIEDKWKSLSKAVLGRHSQDSKNPGTPACANQAARDHSSGLELVIGGDTSRDPNGPTEFDIP